MKKLILAFATVAFIGFGGTAVSAQTPPTTIKPGAPPICGEWNGDFEVIPEDCKDFYIATTTTATTQPAPAVPDALPPVPTTTTTVPVTLPPGDLPRTGSGVSPILGIGALLFVGGGIVVVASRRRTGSAPAA